MRAPNFKDKVEKFLYGEKTRKNIDSTITFDNKLLNVKGTAQIAPMWGLRGLELFFSRYEISLAIENNGNKPASTDNCKQPLVLPLDIKGIPNDIELLKVSPNNPKLILDIKNDKIVLENIQINPDDPLEVVFIAWFAIDTAEF